MSKNFSFLTFSGSMEMYKAVGPCSGIVTKSSILLQILGNIEIDGNDGIEKDGSFSTKWFILNGYFNSLELLNFACK